MHRERMQKWRSENREAYNEYNRHYRTKRYAEDPAFREKIRQQYLKTRAKYRARKADYQRQKLYGLGVTDYNALLAQQKSQCPLCDVCLKKPHVDHDHKTGAVRGLLCTKCNTWLGFFEKQTEVWILKAKHYLLKSRVVPGESKKSA
jgi:hypothetical protein